MSDSEQCSNRLELVAIIRLAVTKLFSGNNCNPHLLPLGVILMAAKIIIVIVKFVEE